jgi:hypothetical protein
MSFDAFATDYFSAQEIASGETDMPRLNAGSTAPLASTNMTLTYWTAQKSEIVNNIETVCGGTAAAATPTYCAMGCYSVDQFGNLTLQGQCANDTTLFSVAFAQNTRPLLSSFFKQAGQRYAFAVLVVTAVAPPTITGYNGTALLSAVAPRLAGQVVTQSVLPSSVLVGNVSGASSMYFGGVTP